MQRSEGKGGHLGPAKRGVAWRIASRVSTWTLRGLAVIGFGSIVAFAPLSVTDLSWTENGSDNGKKKKVIVLPFDRMKLVEQKKARFGFPLFTTDTQILEVEVKELVDLIHAAAQDPEVTALYGIFGGSTGRFEAGLAQIEEIRNAIRVFNESHRVHHEPCLENTTSITGTSLSARSKTSILPEKKSYAYAQVFDNPSSGNKEYYLASGFSLLQMQARGHLKLFGFSESTPFLKGALDMYGINVKIFRSGRFKDTPKILSNYGFDSDHLSNAWKRMKSLEDILLSAISKSRNVDEATIREVLNFGSISAEHAERAGLIDFNPPINPLSDFLFAAKNEDNYKKADFKWGGCIKEFGFDATEAVTLVSYNKALIWRKRRAALKKKMEWLKHSMYEAIASVPPLDVALRLVGMTSPYFNLEKEYFLTAYPNRLGNEKIAVLHVNGLINESRGRPIINAIRKIKGDNNVKCVVLRIDSPGGSSITSEEILMELQNLQAPIICSMGNVAASGGYYIASNCYRIFAMPTTITGSIGAFGVRIDLSDFANRYGVNVEHVVTAPLASSQSIFQPLTDKIDESVTREIDSCYDWFKTIVSAGRRLSREEVESVAEGRIWTGKRAKDVGLIDEFGGLQKAISYAHRTFCLCDEPEVEVWPRPTSALHQLQLLGMHNASNRIFLGARKESLDLRSGVYLAIDEHLAAQLLIGDVIKEPDSLMLGITDQFSIFGG